MRLIIQRYLQKLTAITEWESIGRRASIQLSDIREVGEGKNKRKSSYSWRVPCFREEETFVTRITSSFCFSAYLPKTDCAVEIK